MKVLAVGDIVGSVGINEIKKILPEIIKNNKIDFCIVNGENSAEGMGITEKNFNDIIQAGADCVTMGNHTWGKKEIFKFINNSKILRPINYPEGVVGKGYRIYECKGKRIAVINAMGRAEINVQTENPFLIIEKVLNKIEKEVDYIFLDFHAEASAEKKAMGYFLDGRVTAVFGTHTHVQTADEQILPNGTAYITDIGMTGPKDSIIGMEKEVALKRFLTSLPEKYKIASGKGMFNAVIFETDETTNKVERIRRINN